MVISPDFSMVGNIYPVFNEINKMYSFLVSIWFTLVIGAVVIPNIIFTDESSFGLMIDGLENCDTVCINIMSCLKNKNNKNLLKSAIKYICDNLNLKCIIVYTSSNNDKEILKLFEYASIKKINIHIPDNTLRLRNKGLLDGKNL